MSEDDRLKYLEELMQPHIPLRVLQEIRQEIEEAKEIMNDINGDSYYSIRMNELRAIIDKHIKEYEE